MHRFLTSWDPSVTPCALWSSCRGRCKPTPTRTWDSSRVRQMLAFVLQLFLKRSNCFWAQLQVTLPIYLTGSAESFNECCQATVATGPVEAWAKKTQTFFFFSLPSQLDIHVPSACAYNARVLDVRGVSCLPKQNDIWCFFPPRAPETDHGWCDGGDRRSMHLSARLIFWKLKFSGSFS